MYSICFSGKQMNETLYKKMDKTELLFLPGKGSLIYNPSISIDICGVCGTDCKEPGRDTGWPAVLCWQHYCDNLQIHAPQHQEDTSVPHPKGNAGLDYCWIEPAGLKLTQVLPPCTGYPWLFESDSSHNCAARGSGASYINGMVKPCIPAPQLHSATAKSLADPSRRGGPCYNSTKSRLLIVQDPQWWNELPTDIRTAGNLTYILQHRLKTHLLRMHIVECNVK